MDCDRKALEINPNFFESLLALGQYYQDKGSYLKAIGLLQKAHQAKPKNGIVCLGLVQCFGHLGNC
jgi:tetratricopeptide (TPR) repeat protein